MKTTGLIFDIQRCSLRDGPGIRTTVFLKGCFLRCLWCHNPESVSFKPQLLFNPDRCAHCLACVAACPHGAQQARDGRHVLERDLCQACGACVPACLNDALKIVGEERSVEQVLREVERDVAYYQRSGGGVTLSGGEPMLQLEFTLAFLQASKERGIHTCIETSGFAPQKWVACVLPYVDVFLFDFKETDPQRHKALTGAPNDRILANLDFLYRHGASIILRCPLVPGVNDSWEHLAGIAAISACYPNLVGIELMVYHDLGKDKGRNVGVEVALCDLKTTDEETKARWLETLRELGCKQATLG